MKNESVKRKMAQVRRAEAEAEAKSKEAPVERKNDSVRRKMEKVRRADDPSNASETPFERKNDSVRRKMSKVRAQSEAPKPEAPVVRKNDSVRRKIEKVRAAEEKEKAAGIKKETKIRKEGYVPPKFRAQNAAPPPETQPEAGERPRSRLLDQTPSARRAQKKGKRRQNPESMRRVNIRRSFRVKKKRSFNWKRLFACAALTVVFYGVIAGAIVGLYSFNLLRGAARDSETVSFRIGLTGENAAVRKNLRRGDLFTVRGMRIDMTELAAYCDMTVTGDHENVRFYVRTAEPNLVSLRVGSRTAVINGTPVSLPQEVILRSEDIIVPAELVRRYMTGVHIEYDEEKEIIQVSRDRVEGIYSRTEYVPVGFTVRPFTAPAVIDFGLLDEETRLGIEARYRGSEAEQQAAETEETVE